MVVFIPNFDVASNEDDHTPYCIGREIKEVIVDSEKLSKTLSKWFEYNILEANLDKYHILFNNAIESYPTKVGYKTISNSKWKKLPGI